MLLVVALDVKIDRVCLGWEGLVVLGSSCFVEDFFFFFLAIKAKAAALQCSPCCDIWMFTVNAIPCPWRGFFGSCRGGLQS